MQFPQTRLNVIPSGACLSIFVLVHKPNLLLSQWEKGTAWLPRSLRERARSALKNVTLGLSSLKSLARLSGLLGNSLMQWGFMACNVWLALWAFGITLPPTVGARRIIRCHH